MEVRQAGSARVIVVDSLEIPRFGIAETLRASGRFCQVMEAAEACDALCGRSPESPSLLIVVLRPANGCTFEQLERLSAAWRETPVLVMAVQDERLIAARALNLGARGVVSCDVSRQSLLAAVERVLGGEFYLSPQTMQLLFQTAQDGVHQDAVDVLTPRELDIFQLLGRGKTAREIALDVHLSPKTVEYHRQRIKEKLHISTTADLIRYATMRALQPHGSTARNDHIERPARAAG